MRQPERSPFVRHPVALAACLLGWPAAFALPQGGTPTFGQTDIRQNAPGQLTINQGSARAGIDWTSFSIAAGERVQVIQPGRDSVLVNRVVGNDPSSIFGQLQSNGNVWLINPRGIFFGASSRIDVGGLVATTLNLEGTDASSGRIRLGRGAEGAGEIRSEGQITARDGTVVLAAPQVTHSGTIEARRVGIAAATQVDVDVEGDGLIFFNARNDGTLDTRLKLLGNVLADGGTADVRAAARAGFADTVLNLDGVVRARSIGQRNGRIFIDGGSDGAVIVTGTVNASGNGAGERGGDVTIAGDKVGLAGGSTVDASGQDGGGRIRVGGGFHGADTDMRNASMTVVQSGATLKADAGERGNGGQVVVWSERSTAFAGMIQARGGAQGGDGGQAEVSSKQHLDFQGRADLSATNGRRGALLLDPNEIDIVDAGSQDLNGDGNAGDDLPTPVDGVDIKIAFGDYSNTNPSKITGSAVSAQLDHADLWLQATTAIKVESAVSSAALNRTLTLEVGSGGTISIDKNVSLASGTVHLIGDTNVAAATTLNVGTLALTDGTLGGAGTITAGSLTSDGTASLVAAVSAGTLNVVSGTLTLGSAGRLVGNPNIDVSGGATLKLGGNETTTHAATLAGTLDKTGAGDTLTAFSYGLAGASVNANLGIGPLTSDGSTTLNGTVASTSIEVKTGTLTLGSAGRLAAGATVTVDGNAQLGLGGNEAISSLVLTGGTLGGTGALTAGSVTSTGTASLVAAVSTGSVSVSSGTLTLSGANRLAGNPNIDVSGGATLKLGGNESTTGTLTLAGTLDRTNGADTLTASSLTSSGTASLVAAVNTGTVTVSSGTLTLAAANRLSSSAAVNVDALATLAMSTDQTTGSLAGAGNVNLGGATLSTDTAGSTVFSGTISSTGSTGGLTKTGNGTLRLDGSLTYGGTTTVSQGTLLMGATGQLGNASSLVVSSGATLTLDGDETVQTATLSGTLNKTGATDTLAAATYTLGGGTVNANLGTGTLNVTGSATLVGTSNAATVGIANGGTLTLSSTNRLTAANAAVIVNNGGTLAMSADQTIGALSGGGTVNLGSATLSTGSAGSSSFSGTITGTTGGLTKTGAGTTLTLDGSIAYAGTTTVSGGTLLVGTTGQLGSSSSLVVGGGATLTLNGDKTVKTASLSGTLNKTGATDKLSADTYTLGGGTVNANLGAGLVSVTGDVQLAGTSDSTAVDIADHGHLSLASPERLSDSAKLQLLGSAARLTLNGDETVTTANVTGTIDGSGRLKAGLVDLKGATVGVDLGPDTGELRVSAGSNQLSGSSNQTTVNVKSGATLTLVGGERLADTATVRIEAGATLTLGGAEKVGKFDVSGTLNGGSASADEFVLAGGVFDSDLTGTRLTNTGDSLLNGTSNAVVVNINSGTLTLGAANRLTQQPDLTVAHDATLALVGNETVGSLSGTGTVAMGGSTLATGIRQSSSFAGTLTGGGTLQVSANTLTLTSGASLDGNGALRVEAGATLSLGTDGTVGSATIGGTLAGSATLTAANVNLTGGTVTANLGAGALHSSGPSRLDGQAAVGSVSVDQDTLTLGSSGRFTADPAVSVAKDASLALGGNESFSTLAGQGTVNLAAAPLSIGGNGASSTFDGVIAGGGSLVKQGTGTFTLSGINTYTGGTTVAAGTLALTGTERLADTGSLNVAGFATLTLDSRETVSAATVAGSLGGNGTLVASTFTLDGGSIGANAALVADTLHSSRGSRLDGSATAGSLVVDDGTLTLGSAHRLVAPPAVSVAAGSELALGGDETFATLAGGGTVSLGLATLTTGSGDSTFAGTLGGSGGLIKLGGGTFTLSGHNTFTGSTQVQAGTLALATDDVLADGTAVSVAPNATLLVAGRDTVRSLSAAGAIGGSGTLTATSGYALGNGATVDANLGAGTLTTNGAVALNGRADTGDLQVQSGTLTLGSAGRLSGSPDVTIASGATLKLGGNETTTGAVMLGGTLDRRNDGDTLKAGSLTTNGADARLVAAIDAPVVDVDSGRLTLAGANRLGATAAATVANGATLVLDGDETLGTLSGAGTVDLGSATLSTGSGGDSTFAGSLSGGGSLRKQGAGDFVLSGSSTYIGSTRVDGGALVLADGGSLATSDYVVNGTLRFTHTDGVTLAVPVTGSGVLEQAGTGVLTISGPAKTYTGGTRVSAGTLVTDAANLLPDTGAVSVAANAALELGGAETLGSIDLDQKGQLKLNGDFTTAGAMNLKGEVVNVGGGPLTISGTRIVADNDANRWGSRLSINASDEVTLSSGRSGGVQNDLKLGELNLGAGGSITAGTISLDGLATLSGGTLTLDSAAAQVGLAPDSSVLGKDAPGGRQIGFAADVVTQTGGRIDLAQGAQLSIVSAKGGSISLLADDNLFAGSLAVRSGDAFTAWSANPQTVGGQQLAVQSRVQVAGSTVNIGGAGIEADVVTIRADHLGTAPGAVIAARLPFDNRVGTADSLPGLTLELTPVAFGLPFPFGQAGAEISVSVGSRAWGASTLPIDAGYLRVLPRHGAQGATAVILTGPLVSGGYGFFFDGAGQSGEIPVFYNGALPVTPEVSGSLSATLAVSEGARRERFDESVRTENVAVRLRAGVIAEVGPGRPATVGSEGLKPPASCAPAGESLACEAN
ncbi:MAG: autotransporter-associated beta strand repeat-containing protein [Rubrivivax sp.]